MSASRSAVFLLAAVFLATASPRWAHGITNGQPDDGDPPLYPFVGSVVDIVVPLMCSGVAISPTVLVTAGHCFDVPGQEVWVSFAYDASPGTFPGPDWHRGSWYPHPDFCFACSPAQTDLDTHDIGVVVLDEPVDLASYAVLPAAPGLVESLPKGTRLTLVGYGLQWDTNSGNFLFPEGIFTRHYVAAELSPSRHVNGDEYIQVKQNPAQDKGADCRGDSGGPNLLGNLVLAVTSYGNLACTGVGYANRLDLDYALEFIGEFLD